MFQRFLHKTIIQLQMAAEMLKLIRSVIITLVYSNSSAEYPDKTMVLIVC